MSSADDLFVIGFDTEYTREDEHNKILSYQWFVLHAGRTMSGIVYVHGQRWRLNGLVQRILADAKEAGVFHQYPKSVTLAAHFSLAEMASLADFGMLKKQFDAIRRTFATVHRPLVLSLRDDNGNTRKVAVSLRDTMLLTPQGSSLAALGEMHGLPKIALPEGVIEHMEELLASNPDLFARYAIRDAEIAAKHALAMANLHADLTGVVKVPISLGGLAAEFTQRLWQQEGINALDVLGKEAKTDRVYDDEKHRYRTVRRVVPRAAVHEHEALATESFHGGRNEAYYFGATPVDDWVDLDLCGAYSTALARLGQVRWDELRTTTNLDDFTPCAFGFARVTFKFPHEVKYPCLAVRVPNNLIFPREGEAYATAPEIWLARELGAEIEINHGIVIPTDPTVKPFQRVIAEATKRRKEATDRSDKLSAQLFKEMVNSLYGKTAQGLREKRVFDSRRNCTTPIPPSSITNPFLAAAVTGFIRATLAEIMNALPAARTVVSVTTDGFITNATEGERNIATYGVLCGLFRQSRQDLTGNDQMIEIKHRATQVLCWRTRGQATIQQTDGGAPILAKAGIKAPHGMDKIEQNTWIIDLFTERDVHTTYEFRNLRPLSKIYKMDGDLVQEEFVRRVKMDFDFKRRPILPAMTTAEGQPHLSFGTEPWNTEQEFSATREAWANFHADTGRCLKTLEDFEAFEEFRAGSGLHGQGLQRSKCGGMVKVALRQITRAFVRNRWGLSSQCMSYKEFALFLHRGGYFVRETDVKNASRPAATLATHAIDPTGAVLQLVKYINRQFPAFDASQLLQIPAETNPDRKLKRTPEAA